MEMKSVKFVLLAAASLAISVQGASFKSEIVLLPGEVWWGGGGGDDLGEEHLGPKTLNLKNVPLDRLPRYERIQRDF